MQNEEKIDFTHVLPHEIVREIFAYLNAQELGKCLLVSKNWRKLASHKGLWNALPPRIAFGKEQWEKYFGVVDNVPPLPKDIHDILNSQCPFWKGKKVRETHILVLIPDSLNGKPLNLKTLGELVESPKGRRGTQYNRYALADWIFKQYDDQATSKSHWALLTKDIVPGSKYKSYLQQQALIFAMTGGEYEVPHLLDATISIFMHYIISKEQLFNRVNDLWTYTRCQEKVNDFQLLVGGFSTDGLNICNIIFGENVGVAAMRKFF